MREQGRAAGTTSDGRMNEKYLYAREVGKAVNIRNVCL